MATHGARTTGVNSKPVLGRKNSVEGDPWCLTCGANLKVEGGTFVKLSRVKAGDLCDLMARVLGAEFSDEYASINMCNRCERQLRRLGRYNSIVLARNEGKKLREQLEKNLAKYGQTVVESGDVQEAPSSSPPKVAGKTTVSFAAKTVRGPEGILRKRLGDISSKTSGSGKVSVHNEAGRNVRKTPGGISALLNKKVSPVSQVAEVDVIPEEKSQKFVNGTSVNETSAEKPAVPPRTVSFQDEHVSKSEEETLMSHADDADVRDEPEMESSSDKAALVARSESLDESNRHDLFKRQGKFLNFGFRSASDSKKNDAQVNRNQDEIAVTQRAGDIKDNAVGELTQKDKESPVHWSGRVNPFDVEEKKDAAASSFDYATSFDDDVFVKDIIDLDDAQTHQTPQPSRSLDSVQTMDSVNIVRELMTDLDQKTFKDFSRASSTSVDSEPDVDPNDYNADNRSSLSEVEERINIKTQFKGAYYNIGSTEDLLQEFENELAADKARACKLTPINSFDKDDGQAARKIPKPPKQDDGEKPQGEGQGRLRTKGKVLKYESLDLDLEQSNPFIDDVYGEYNRRITAKKRAKTGVIGSSPRLKPRTNIETIPESETQMTQDDVEANDSNDADGIPTIPTGTSCGLPTHAESTSSTTTTPGEELTNTEEDKPALGNSRVAWEPGKDDQDNIPLVDKENEDNKGGDQDEADVGPEDEQAETELSSEDVPQKEVVSIELEPAEAVVSPQVNDPEPIEVLETAVKANGIISESSMPCQYQPTSLEVQNDVESKENQDDPQLSQEVPASTPKSEKSPLISSDLKVKDGKETKFKDHQPGFLCCTIL